MSRMIRLLLAVASLNACLRYSHAQEDSGPFLFRRGDKFGFTNASGIVVEPIYDDASPFSCGRAIVNVGGSWGGWGQRRASGGKDGAIDVNGKTVIPAKYEGLASFSEGLAFFYLYDVTERWIDDGTYVAVTNQAESGFLDTNGNVVIQFEGIVGTGSFSEGFVQVYRWGSNGIDRTDYIDRTGQNHFSVVGVGNRFSEGMADFSLPPPNRYSCGKCGFIDRTGKVAIEPQFGALGSFHGGLAAAQTWTPANDNRNPPANWGYVNKSGTYVVPPQFNVAHPFRHGMAIVHTGGGYDICTEGMSHWEGGEWKVIDAAGNILYQSHNQGECYRFTKTRK